MKKRIFFVNKSLLIVFISVLLLLIACEVGLGVFLQVKNNEVKSYTQLSISEPLNVVNKIYFSAKETSKWASENSKSGSVYECDFCNTTKNDFADWSINIKLPENCVIESFWNAVFEYSDESRILKIYPYKNDREILKKHSKLSFGFLIRYDDDFLFRTVTFSGRKIKSVFESIIFNIILGLIFTIILTIVVIIIDHSVINYQIQWLKEQKKRDDKIIEQTMQTFVQFIDAKDEYTRGHSARVAKYSRAIAKQLGYDEEFQKSMYYMGLMHDIGKLAIPDEILNKTTRLSSDEWEIIQLHTSNGARMLKDFTIMPELKNAVLYHHERYDGKGYINQLKGEDIPLSARIICVADSFDAMNTNRCYRLKFTKERIMQELERCAGKQFDPKIVPAMVELIRCGAIDLL